jgi:hypothetical protein
MPYFYAYIQDFTGQYPTTINFTFTGSNWDINSFFTIRLNITLIWRTDVTSTVCSTFDGFIDIYPARVPAPSLATPLANPVANLNNNISGNSNYNYINTTYAPYGRYYWTHGHVYTGPNQGVFLYSPGEKAGLGFQIINPNGKTSNLSFNAMISSSIVNKGSSSSAIGIQNLSSYTSSYSQGF